MKKILILVLLGLTYKNSLCQVNLKGTEERVLILSMGTDETFINNPTFDSWTKLNYNLHEGYVMSGHLDISFVSKAYDFGIHANAPYPYGIYSFYFGRRLTGLQSPVSSFLNIEAGAFEAIYTNISPLNYTPSPDQQGQQLQLHYNATYLGLSSRNYLNKLHFTTGKGKNAISHNSGFYVDFGAEPWGGDWEYGYYKGSGKESYFKSRQVFGIPGLGKTFLDIGIFIGIGN
ncbi:MAG TPA: hypothetical protein VFE53_01645 [Mucilaginibacter sp.]|jgi:hypothetical protein|nr:hypothetical protein [Mucilaginibacter sp.]